MRPPAHVRIPKYCHHKARNRAFILLDGKFIYLPGPFGSEQSRREYDRLIGLWSLNGRRLPNEPSATALAPAAQATVAGPVSAGFAKTTDQLIEVFLAECERDYPPRNGYRNGELACIESALASLSKLYGPAFANQVEPLHLELVMRDYIARGFCRKMVNRNLSYLKRLFKWAVKHRFVSGETYYQLLTVDGVRKGRAGARDNPPVRPVDDAVVEATLPYLSDEVKAMVQIQLLTGMRGDEVARMRVCDLDRSGSVWRYNLEKHKTAHHGITRQVPLGPKAQAIIKSFLTDDTTEYLFSPQRAEAKRRAKQHAARTTPASCGNVPGSNRKQSPEREPGDRYTAASYGRAIARACCKAFPFPAGLSPDTTRFDEAKRAEYGKKHGQEAYDRHHAQVVAWYERHRWHPHQLRHSASTKVARRFGEIASQTLLGHTTLKTTAIYTERDWSQAERVMAEVG